MPRVRLVLFRKNEARQRLERRRRARMESRMSLRIRFILLVVALVAVVAVALSMLYLDNLVRSRSDEAIERGQLASRQVDQVLRERFNQQSAKYQAPATVEDTRKLWREIVESDPDLNIALLTRMAPIPSISEINVAGDDGEVLASSKPQRIGTQLPQLQDLLEWEKEPLIQRVVDVSSRSLDWERVTTLGDKTLGDSVPIFKIQVVTSSVLLRGLLLPEMQRLAVVSGGSFLAVIVLTVLSTNLVLRPLKRIELTIDRIVQGGEEPAGMLVARKNRAREFAVVENKLDLLGQQFRGAREDASELRHNVDKLIERLATQLDVATRLAAISRLTGGVAHEIKNPLNAISLHLDLLKEMSGAPPEEQNKMLNILSKEVLRLDRVVKTFLDFSRPVEVHFEDVDLAAVTREVSTLMTPQARLARVTLETETPAGAALMRADADMIKQVVLNLVTNAMEAMRDGGRLRIAVRGTFDAVTLEIADTGPGIPPDLRDKVFQLYFTTKPRGSGIGLAMTYRAVQLHNGTITFTSEEGQGTTFYLQFPVVGQHA
jgi:signal transduction histidine kinase